MDPEIYFTTSFAIWDVLNWTPGEYCLADEIVDEAYRMWRETDTFTDEKYDRASTEFTLNGEIITVEIYAGEPE